MGDALIEEANAALAAAGHSRRLFVDPSDRRKLAENCVNYRIEVVPADKGSEISSLSSDEFKDNLKFVGDGNFWQGCEHPFIKKSPISYYVCMQKYYATENRGIIDDDGNACDTEIATREDAW